MTNINRHLPPKGGFNKILINKKSPSEVPIAIGIGAKKRGSFEHPLSVSTIEYYSATISKSTSTLTSLCSLIIALYFPTSLI